MGQRPIELGAVTKYIRHQKSHHEQMGYETEFIGLLDKHGLTYDERYLWD